MAGLRIETNTAGPPPAVQRADIACFVGFVPPVTGARNEAEAASPTIPSPIWVESWERFLASVPWRSSVRCGDGEVVPLYLGAAVRSFFRQGGQRCYVVAITAPTKKGPTADWESWARAILPCLRDDSAISPDQRDSWCGLGAILALPDVSWVSMPDLAPLCSGATEALPPLDPPSRPKAVFQPASSLAIECTAPPDGTSLGRPRARRCRPNDLLRWASLLRAAGRLLHRYARSVQLVAALPLPAPGTDFDLRSEEALAEYLSATQILADRERSASPESFGSAFIQLVYPWLRTAAGGEQPEALEPPEGAFIGALAQSARRSGAFLSATRVALVDVLDTVPQLQWRGQGPSTLRNMVSLIGWSPSGFEILSDVTSSPLPSLRPASVGRLLGIVVRAARRMGEHFAFEPNDPTLWSQLRAHVTAVLSQIWAEGGLQGERQQAFHVRCDRGTTTADDVDAGRVVLDVQLTPVQSLEQLTVSLVLAEGTSLVPEKGAWA